MSGSAKGRVLGPKAARDLGQHKPEREGSCAWCGLTIFAARAALQPVVQCSRCGSTEIDWLTPTPPPENHYTRDEGHLSGVLSFALRGARVYGRR